MFRAAVERTGVTPPPVPPELRVIDSLDRALGGALTQPVETREDVMKAYLLLQVLEERAVTQFGIMEPAFRAFDPETADVFVAIGRDEQRHLRYCHAIARRYAPDAGTQARTLAHYRATEARVYAQNSSVNLRYAFEQGLLDVGVGGRVFWRGLDSLMGVIGREQRTPFWGQPPVRDARGSSPASHVDLAEAA
jgi:hypothetical protein